MREQLKRTEDEALTRTEDEALKRTEDEAESDTTEAGAAGAGVGGRVEEGERDCSASAATDCCSDTDCGCMSCWLSLLISLELEHVLMSCSLSLLTTSTRLPWCATTLAEASALQASKQAKKQTRAHALTSAAHACIPPSRHSSCNMFSHAIQPSRHAKMCKRSHEPEQESLLVLLLLLLLLSLAAMPLHRTRTPLYPQAYVLPTTAQECDVLSHRRCKTSPHIYWSALADGARICQHARERSTCSLMCVAVPAATLYWPYQQ